MPDSLAADLDAECAACLMGARRMAELFDRYGRDLVEACFDAILDNTTDTFRREILSKIPDGTYVWEDYAEHDGVDEPRLHTQRITLTKVPDEGGRIIIDYTDGSAGQGAHQPLRGLRRRQLPQEVAGADPAQPRRLARPDGRAGRQRGCGAADRDAVSPSWDAAHAGLPRSDERAHVRHPAAARRIAGVLAKAVDGRMPADQETIRYTGLYGDDADGQPYLREVLGGGSGGRYYADGEDTIHVVPDSRNLPTEFSEARFPFVVERLGLAVDSGGAGRYRGGCGYEKHIRMLKDAHFMSIADRSILACWGVRGGRAGKPFDVTVDLGGPDERVIDALTDAEPVAAGQVIRIRTTGGGGWGDPLERPYDEVARDVAWGKVSVEGARSDYGVALQVVGSDVEVDEQASGQLRDDMRRERVERIASDGDPFFDRGPGYRRLSGGAAYADVDLI